MRSSITSWEAWDELRRLDASLGWFFGELDKRKGASHWSALLSADHGVAPLPEVSRAMSARHAGPITLEKRPRDITERVLASSLERTARAAARSALGKGEWIAAVLDSYVYLSDQATALDQARRKKLYEALAESLAKNAGVAKVFNTSALPVTCPPLGDESLDALVCRSVSPGIGGAFYIALRPGYFFDTGYVPGFGTSHGNAALYDRTVPLLIRAPGHAEAGKVVDEQMSFALFAQLLEAIS
jgi:hypothetical protein